MARLVFIICAIGVVCWLLRRVLRQRTHLVARRDATSFAPTARCTRCGAYADRRLMQRDGQGYCCREHDPEGR